MQTFTYSIKKVVFNEDNETSSSEIRELRSEKAVTLTRLKECLRAKYLSPYAQAVRKSRAAL
jgi:hypothetical protein